jgi:hypothetical protein
MKVITFLLLCATFVTPAFTQEIRHVKAVTIPDSIAYCMFFQAASFNPHELLGPVGLAPADERAAINVIATFESEFRAHGDAFDAGHETRGQFLAKRDFLVAAARSQLSATLSRPGLARFDAFVQNEKTRMHIQPKASDN